MTDTNTTENHQVTDVNLDPNLVVEAMSNEIGILSGQLVVSSLKLKASLNQINLMAAEVRNLRIRLASQDTDIKAMREQLMDPNHPSKRNAKKTK